MNKERVLALAELIESQPLVDTWCSGEVHGFNMNREAHICGTPSCILGWAAWEQRGRPDRVEKNTDRLYTDAQEYLGLDDGSIGRLCYPDEVIYGEVTPAMAGETLRKLAETGEVDWSHAPQYVESADDSFDE
jgi:hypothetical protein